MVEKKSSYVFDETLILNQLFDDMAHGRVKNIASPLVQKNRQIQETLYQSARQKKNQYFEQNKENLNCGLDKKNHGIGFWHKAPNYDSALLAGSMNESDKLKAGFKNDSFQPSSDRRFGYDSSSSGE